MPFPQVGVEPGRGPGRQAAMAGRRWRPRDLADVGLQRWKALGPLMELGRDACAPFVGDWHTATNLRQRRASATGFANLAKKGDENFTRPTVPRLGERPRPPSRSGPVLPDRTGAWWVLRELCRPHPERVDPFISVRIGLLSREALRSATKELPEDVKERRLKR